MANGNHIYVRYEARSPQGVTALEHYATAVTAMRERGQEDPTSWSYQAAIHGSNVQPPLALWNQCEHLSWYFLPWHRMYLYYFERIVRKAVVDAGGPGDWALPYWNYGLGGQNASLPPQFREPPNQANSLYVAQRIATWNQGNPLPAQVINDSLALARPNYIGNAEFGGEEAPPGEGFWGRQGELESTPHNDVHSTLGGWMGNGNTAAQDPIFWLHHANIDRIWAVWNEGEDREDPNQPNWLNQSWEFFDENGNQVTKSCSEVRETIPDLSYTYDPPPAGMVEEVPPPPTIDPDAPPPPEEPKFVAASEETVPLEGQELEVPVEIDPRAREEVLEAANPEDPRRLYLNIEDIQGESNPSTVYGIYLNLPDGYGQEELERRYLGNLSFFGIEDASAPAGDKHPHGMRVSVEAGNVIRILRDETDWDGEYLKVCFRPVTPPPEGEYAKDETIRIGRISLSIDA